MAVRGRGPYSSYEEVPEHYCVTTSYSDELERKIKFRNHILFMISEILIEESKMNISQEEAIKRIRRHIYQLNTEDIVQISRPKRENFKSRIEYDEYGPLDFNGVDDYYEALEKYCDDSDAMFDGLAKTLDIVSDYNEKLEKALDKICEKMAFASNEHVIEELDSFTLGEINRTKEQWREWSMEDE